MTDMNPIVRSILAILAGIFVVLVMITLIEAASSGVHPLPEDFDWRSREQIALLPAQVFLTVLFAWQAGAFVGGLLSAWVAGRWQMLHASVIGCFVFFATLANFLIIPGHPGWMVAAGLILPMPMALLGGGLIYRLAKR
jgi:hypothetical protein